MLRFNHDLPPIVHFQSVSGKVGFPERQGPLIYLPFCNLNCPYCLNKKVVNGGLEEIPFDIVEKHFKKFEESFVFISGGEPLLHNKFPNLIRRLKSFGLKVGVSTNGTRFEELRCFIEELDGDFVALDIKTNLLNIKKWETIGNKKEDLTNITKSISLINSYVGKNNFGQEFRTTLYPPLVEEDDFKSIMWFIDSKALWVLQQFRGKNGSGLLGGDDISKIKPYSDEILYNWLEVAKSKIPNTILRWP